jgi:adenylate kinase
MEPSKKGPVKVIMVLGGPGAGKGTQCGLLCDKYKNIVSFSAGDLLRAAAKDGTELGNKIAE